MFDFLYKKKKKKCIQRRKDHCTFIYRFALRSFYYYLYDDNYCLHCMLFSILICILDDKHRKRRKRERNSIDKRLSNRCLSLLFFFAFVFLLIRLTVWWRTSRTVLVMLDFISNTSFDENYPPPLKKKKGVFLFRSSSLIIGHDVRTPSFDTLLSY